MYTLKVTEEMGRGLYASKFMMAGTVVFEAELLVLSPEDTVTVNKTELQYYTFKFNDAQDCLVLGDGEIFNHDGHPNVMFELVDVDGRKKMRFTTNQWISEGDQLFIDYNADVNVVAADYIAQKSLVG